MIIAENKLQEGITNTATAVFGDTVTASINNFGKIRLTIPLSLLTELPTTKDTTKEGMRCTVKFTDRTIKETWLWNNGTIPKEYNVKNNACFV